MTIDIFEKIELNAEQNNSDSEEEYSIPLCIDDIITICKEYNILGWNIQFQVENILELGVAESIKTGIVKRESLPHIRKFLTVISKNPYFGDACSQSIEVINLIDLFEINTIKNKSIMSYN